MKKKIYQIVNNYGSIFDGVGKYGEVIGEELSKDNDVEVCTEETYKYSLFKSFFSRKMFSCFDKVEAKLNKNDFVLIEYPFVDKNPFVYKKIWKLFNYANRVGAFVVLSLHEYERTNFIRRWTIRKMVKYCHCLLVTKESQKLFFSKIVPTFIRPIPSLISIASSTKKEIPSFVFFGLINKAKAIQPMIQGWESFTKKHVLQTKLNIVTSSNVDSSIKDSNNILVLKDLPDKEVGMILSQSTFSILPIMPSISKNNSTFWSSLQAGCIPVGVFDLEGDYFAIRMEDYSPNSFLNAFEKCLSLDDKDIQKYSSLNSCFAKKNGLDSLRRIVNESLETFLVC